MVSIVIGGDFCPYKEESSLDKFKNISTLFRGADYSIVNLECPIDSDLTYRPIRKIGPNLRSYLLPSQLLVPLGVSAVTLANNHFKDYGSDCCQETLKLLKNANINTVGAGTNIEEAKSILYETLNDITVAFINSCENEFSIATSKDSGANPVNSIQQYYDIQKARQKADVIIVIVHGGIEMYNLPTPKMQERYRFFIDCGADIVVNHHQHCYSGREIYKGKHIYYGLGNLYFPLLGKANKIWEEGFLIKIILDKKSIVDVVLIPFTQSYEKGICIGDSFEFAENFKRLSQICSNSEDVKRQYDKLCACETNTYNFINPYKGRILRGLARRGYIPSFISKESLLELLGKIRCESHYDRFVKFIENRII